MTRLAIALGLILLLAPAAGLARGQSRVGQREASIFYYPWYGNPKWDGAYLHWDQGGHVPPLDLASSYYPARGAYSSRDPKIVAAQMHEIAAAGIHEVVSSWWGQDSGEDLRLPMIIQMAGRVGLQVAVQLEPYGGRTAETVASDLAHLKSIGISRVYVYHPFTVDDASWPPVLASVPGLQVLAQTANVARAQAAHFAGVYTYDVSMYGPAAFGPLCARAHRAGLICAPSVGPGYDALRATGDVHVRSRDRGATYDAMWKAAIRSGADLVTITSYNEWHEGTQIEPASVPVSRHLDAVHGPLTSPVTQAYASYDGAYGLHGRQASTAYLTRTAYWTTVYRTGQASPPSGSPARKAAAQGRKATIRAERGRMIATADRRPDAAPAGLKLSADALFGVSGTNLRLGALPSRLIPAVRVRGSDTVVRPLGHGALVRANGSVSRSCYRARRPQALLEMSVIARCASSSGDSRICTRRTVSRTCSYWGKS